MFHVVKMLQANEAREGSRARRRLESTERIVEAAAEMIRDDGFEALTMHRLARGLGYAVGALYRYFDSKDDLLVAVLGRALDRFRDSLLETHDRVTDALSTAPAPGGEAALTYVAAASLTFETFARSCPADYRIISTSVGDPRELAPTDVARQVVPLLEANSAHLARLLDDASAAGALPDGDHDRRAVSIWAVALGSLQIRKFGRLGLPQFAPAGMLESVTVNMLRGWGADPTVVDAAMTRARGILGVAP